MALANTVQRVRFTGDGNTVTFAYTWRIFVDGDLRVYTTVTGVDTLQTIDTDYTVTGANTTLGGTVVYNTAPVLDSTITIVRDTIPTQNVELNVGGPFPSSTVELALDKHTAEIQDLKEQLGRIIPDYSVTSSGVGPY